MRIISGRFKGKIINFIKTGSTRPLKDSVKENIFNILNHSNEISINIKNSKVLDLYSGIGSFGLECLSRGSKKVTFVEFNENAFSMLKENISKLSMIKKVYLINNKIENIKNWEKGYDIFFLDPPFADNEFINSLKMLKGKKLFKKKHIVVIHREKSSKDNFTNILNILKIRTYGRSKIIFGIFS